MSGKNGDKRQYISRNSGRHGFRSQDTSLSFSRNRGVTVDFYLRGGYSYHTIHYSSHILVYNSILLRLSGASCRFHEIICDNETGDSRVYDGRRVIRSQETIHSSFHYGR